MSLSFKYLFICFFICMLFISSPHTVYSQGKRGVFMYKDQHGIERSIIRKVLNQFSLTLMTGYGRTYYNHDLAGFSLLQKGNSLYLIENSDLTDPGPNTGLRDWVTSPQYAEGLYHSTGDALINNDTTDIAFKVRGSSIPLLIGLHYNISRFRLGAGLALEYHTIGRFSPKFNENFLSYYEGEKITTMQTRFFGILGARVYDYWDYSFVIDAHFGKHNRGGVFDKNLMDQGLYLNLGVAIEKNLSEYFRLVLRPSYEFSSYTLQIPESAKNLEFKSPTAYLQAGISLTYPEIPRCPIKSCQTQMKHIHYGKEFRGQPLHKKQVPGYGENHPELEMYKGRKKGERNTL